MNEKDNINKLFERLEGSFDLEATPSGHQHRFMEKLEAYNKEKPQPSNWWKPLSIAASIAILLTVGIFSYNPNPQSSDLASVSPEMEKTQSFFAATIHQEIEKLKSLEDEGTQKLVADALERLEFLEINYEKLKVDLVESGNDKRVIAAMIANFQNRIEILEHVITTIEEINTLKANRNETTI